MGRDIRLIVERKTPGGWVVVRLPDCYRTVEDIDKNDGTQEPPACVLRNYPRFDRLTEVAEMGIPADAAESTRYLAFEDQAVEHGSLPLEKAAEIFAATERNPGALSHLMRGDSRWYYFDVSPYEKDEHRLIFWFDQ